MSTFFSTERADGRSRIRPVTIIGLLLVPFVIAGLLVWALWDPSDRLDTVKAAVVNNDEPVTVDGQTVPLGRQLGAGLVGSDDEDTNYSWEVTDSSGAKQGLKDGTYAAVVTIPENFSEAATSTSEPDDAEKALIDVTTSDKSKLVDDAVSQVVTSTAANVLGESLTSTYLDNVLLGFNSLHDQLGSAADGARDLADGTSDLSDGTDDLADGANKLADKSDDLVSGTDGLKQGADGLADGANKLTGGANDLASGAQDAAGGADDLAGGANDLAGGLDQLAGGLHSTADGMSDLPDQSKQIVSGLDEMSGLLDTVQGLKEAAGNCIPEEEGAEPDLSSESCQALIAGVKDLGEKADDVDPDDIPSIDEVQSQLDQAKTAAQQLGQLPAGIEKMADAADDSADGARGLASGISGLKGGLNDLSGGADQLAGGIGQLGSGATQLSDGIDQYADGITQYTDGVVSLADGVDDLSGGVDKLDDGAQGLADGLDTAVDQIPTYSDSQRENLADVVSDPVSTSDDDDSGLSFGSGIPLYVVIALWFGAMATYVVIRATPRGALGSTRSAFRMMLSSALPGIVLGVVQGVLVSVIVSIAQSLSFGTTVGFAVVASLIGAAFATVNQALVAAFGGTGRFVSMLIGILALATGVISTVPGVLESIVGVLPVSPAHTAFASVLIGVPGLTGAIITLIVWLVGAGAATTLSVALRRTITARRLAARPA